MTRRHHDKIVLMEFFLLLVKEAFQTSSMVEPKDEKL